MEGADKMTSGTTVPDPNWVMLVDPVWQDSEYVEKAPPPPQLVLGMWPVADGMVGKFHPNRDYVPDDDDMPTDPFDAALRLFLQKEVALEHVQLMLGGAMFDLAMNADGTPMVVESPDDVPCLLAFTAEVHRQRATSPAWDWVDFDGLVESLPDGVDVLFNSGSVRTVRLTGEFLDKTAALSDEEQADLVPEWREIAEKVRFVHWSSGPGEQPDTEHDAAATAAGGRSEPEETPAGTGRDE